MSTLRDAAAAFRDATSAHSLRDAAADYQERQKAGHKAMLVACSSYREKAEEALYIPIVPFQPVTPIVNNVSFTMTVNHAQPAAIPKADIQAIHDALKSLGVVFASINSVMYAQKPPSSTRSITSGSDMRQIIVRHLGIEVTLEEADDVRSMLWVNEYAQ